MGDTTTTSLSAATTTDATFLATSLGYLVGAGSLILYTPIAVRILRQRTADGLTLSTWWLKLAAYSCSDIYAFTNGYPLSTYVETLIITAEAFVVLILVAHYQKRMEASFAAGLGVFLVVVVLGISVAPPELVAVGQAGAALLNVGALIPQFQLNAKLQTAGGYSPVTAGLAATGCLIRVFTTIQLADSDPLLMGTFGLALVLNSSLFLQIMYYGVMVEKRDVWAVLAADLKHTESDVDAEMMDVAKSKKEEDLLLLGKK
jgi:mannose-P-dolichol utilization defect protein 1